MHEALNGMGYNTLESGTPIIPLVIGEDHAAFAFTQKLYENGVFATPVISPAVPPGSALIRTSYMATHSKEDLDFVLEVLERLGKEFGVLNSSKRNMPLRERKLIGASV